MVDAIVDVTDGERGSIPTMVFHYNIASAPWSQPEFKTLHYDFLQYLPY